VQRWRHSREKVQNARKAPCFLHCNSRDCSQAATNLRETDKPQNTRNTRKANRGEACLPRISRIPRLIPCAFGCGSAALCLLRLFAAYYGAVKMVSPAPLGKQRSRDAKDDPYLACALAAPASFLVSRDEDLLVLGKPFGIEIITPRELLTRLAERGRQEE